MAGGRTRGEGAPQIEPVGGGEEVELVVRLERVRVRARARVRYSVRVWVSHLLHSRDLFSLV